MRTSDAIYLKEFIGLETVIKASTNPTLKGRKGVIVDETKRTIVINDGGKDVVIPKDICLFEIRHGTGNYKVLGRDILFRPEDRIKEHRKIERLIRKGGN